jgi:hypothetical protein
VSTRTRIEWFTGERLGYQTADELGLEHFTGRKRKLNQYMEYARRKQRRSDDASQMWRIYWRTRNPTIWVSLHARNNAIARNKYFRKLGYPNLRKAWAKRRENAARRRAEKDIEEQRERQRKQLKQYGL